MNVKELAEKIIDALWDKFHSYSGTKQDYKDRARFLLEALLTEFSKESFKEGLAVGRETLHELIAAERNECAKVAEACYTKKQTGFECDHGNEIAAQIRRRGEGK